MTNEHRLCSTGNPAWCSVEGNPRKRGEMYVCSWFTLLHNRNRHNIVKQLNTTTTKSGMGFLHSRLKGDGGRTGWCTNKQSWFHKGQSGATGSLYRERCDQMSFTETRMQGELVFECLVCVSGPASWGGNVTSTLKGKQGQTKEMIHSRGRSDMTWPLFERVI